jgi:hypothetical protein
VAHDNVESFINGPDVAQKDLEGFLAG